MNIEKYLAAHDTRQIKSGKSGAEVWEIDNKYVLKHMQKAELPEPEVFTRCQNEAFFYQFCIQNRPEALLSCLPEVLEVQVSDQETLILMKKYQALSRDRIDEEILQKIMRTLAEIHTQEIPAFLRREPKPPEYLGKDQIEYCAAGWRSVLAEHPGVFDDSILMEAAAEVNELIGWHHEEAQVLTHGDFHWDNLLLDENGDILVSDWQNVNAGGASGDISFFLSRLGADGVSPEPENVTALYSHERFRLTGERISPEHLLKHMKAANVLLSFQCWHQYLHGSSCGRVREIYEKMGADCSIGNLYIR